MKVEISSVHLDKNNKVKFSYKEMDEAGSAQVEKGPFTDNVHQDLIDTMGRLSVHLAVMSGQIKPSEIKNIEVVPEDLTEGFRAKSYTFTGEKTKGIVISGNRVLPSGKVFNFNTPNYLLDEVENTRYLFMEDLLKWVDKLNVEGVSFLDGSKRGEVAQQSLKFESEPKKEKKTTIQILKPDGLNGEWTAEQYKAATKKSGIPVADPEAMGRVIAGFAEDAHEVEEKAAPEPAKRGRPKRVVQTAANPSGIVDETL